MNLFAIFLAIATAFVAHASAGCISPEVEFEASPGGPSVLFELQFQRNTQGPLKRHIWIHIPKNYKHNKPSPVILAFHGKGQDVLDFEKATNLSNPVVNQEYVIVYPEGLNVSLRVAPQRLLEPLNCSARYKFDSWFSGDKSSYQKLHRAKQFNDFWHRLGPCPN